LPNGDHATICCKHSADSIFLRMKEIRYIFVLKNLCAHSSARA
jgi:hypothetical protein